jgi:hypothetical protein
MPLPPEPKRQDYPDQETFEEALAYWRHRAGPILRAVQLAQNPSKGFPGR